MVAVADGTAARRLERVRTTDHVSYFYGVNHVAQVVKRGRLVRES